VHIHKTGGTSITAALEPYLAKGDIATGPSFGAIRNTLCMRRHGIKKHSRAAAARRAVGPDVWDSYFTFAFVRNPYRRVTSLYHFFENAYRRRKTPSLRNLQYRLPWVSQRDPLRWPGLRAYAETQSLSEFLRHPGFAGEAAGTRTQLSMLADAEGRMLVDFVGRYERLPEDFRAAVEAIGLPDAELGWRNASRNTTGGGVTLTKADRDLLWEMYRDDFEAFGYRRDEG
jgi:hypothetical protein